VPRRHPVPPSALAALRADQDDVVRRSQLAALGIDADKVRHEVAAGRWQRYGSTVVVLHTGTLTQRQLHWAAVLAQPGRAALAGITAATTLGLQWTPTPDVHIVVPYGSRWPALDNVVCHISRRFSELDLHPVRTPPTVRIARALVDAASWTAAPRPAVGVLAAGVQQRLTTAERLRAELAGAGLVRHSHLLGQCLDDIEGGADSFAEIDLGRIAVAAGLPRPRRQSFRLDASGRRRFIDTEFACFDAEVDGALHLRPLSYWDDMSRQNDLVIAGGRPLLRFSTLALRIDVATVRRQLIDAHRRFGQRRHSLPA
jgi:hypothetical protein